MNRTQQVAKEINASLAFNSAPLCFCGKELENGLDLLCANCERFDAVLIAWEHADQYEQDLYYQTSNYRDVWEMFDHYYYSSGNAIQRGHW